MSGTSLLVSLGAASATTVGALLGVISMGDSKRLLSASMGMSAGVMIYISLVDVMSASHEAFSKVPSIGETYLALLFSTVFFFIGVGVTILLDVVTHKLHPDSAAHGLPEDSLSSSDIEMAPASFSQEKAVAHFNSLDAESPDSPRRVRLQAAIIVTAIAVALHNFPEGLASYVATVRDPRLGLTVALAIGVHNVPEGFCVAVPIYLTTGSRLKAVGIAAVTGLLEFIGSVVAWLLPEQIFSEFFFGVIFAGTSGMMMFVSFAELLPVARQYDTGGKTVTKAVFFGMFIMAVSLILISAADLA